MKTKDACLDWLCVVPLCHFLSGSCEPFGSPDDKARNFETRAEKFGYRDIRNKLTAGYDYSLL